MAASRKAMRPRMAMRLAATELTTLTAAMAPFDAASMTLRAGLGEEHDVVALTFFPAL